MDNEFNPHRVHVLLLLHDALRQLLCRLRRERHFGLNYLIFAERVRDGRI
jgi:hypothetical protein